MISSQQSFEPNPKKTIATNVERDSLGDLAPNSSYWKAYSERHDTINASRKSNPG
jgi:hypothetical protein